LSKAALGIDSNKVDEDLLQKTQAEKSLPIISKAKDYFSGAPVLPKDRASHSSQTEATGRGNASC